MEKLSPVKQYMLSLSDPELFKLLRADTINVPVSKEEAKSDKKWFDKPIRALTDEGTALLTSLEIEQSGYPGHSSKIDKKQLRYLKQLDEMRFIVPDCFRDIINPKEMYKRLDAFCISHDIPGEIISRLVPALVSYIETGHMRPVIFVGEKGCGKTTAVRLLVQEALHLPTEIIKVPQTDGGHGMSGDCGTFQAADCGYIAKARLRNNSVIIAYLFDEIDKVSCQTNRAGIDDELLSITDESVVSVFDNYLDTTMAGLEHCPMFFTANDLQKVSPILADRCTVIRFPNANAARIKSIMRKYVDETLENRLYSAIEFNYDVMNTHIDRLISKNITSLRKHQQMIESVLESALTIALVQESDDTVRINDEMFLEAEDNIFNSVQRTVGFSY